MKGKVARSVGILNKLQQTLPQTVMLLFYYALVHPLLLYDIIIWGATYLTYLQKLKSLQNRAIRAIVGAHFRDLVNPYFSQLKILQIDDLFKFEVARFVYGSVHNKTPNSFHKYFCKINDRWGRTTRQSSDCNNLNIPLVAVLINYRDALNIKESGFEIAFPKILGHSRTKNSNIATKTSYYFGTNISIKDFCWCSVHTPSWYN